MLIQTLFRKEDRWIQRDMAIDAQRRSVDVSDPEAVCFCLAGALTRCYPDSTARQKAIRKISRVLARTFNWHGGIIGWNDESVRTITDIRKVVRLAGV